MHYPANYGYIPHTLADDGDPADVLVITPFPLQAGVVVRCRPLGILKMQDEAGGDSKLLAAPISKTLPWYDHWRTHEDVGHHRLGQIQHFFEHYKDLEPGKWVKVIGWGGPTKRARRSWRAWRRTTRCRRSRRFDEASTVYAMASPSHVHRRRHGGLRPRND